MRCPNCGAKIKRGNDRCLKCGTRIDDIKKASHQKALTARKEYQPELVVYTTIFPNDLSYKATLMWCLFFGWIGAHCYYVHRPLKAILQTCFFGLFFIFVIPFGIFMQNGEVGFLTSIMTFLVSSKIYVLFCVLGAVSVITWAFDFLSICFKNFAVPVVIPQKTETVEPISQTFKNKQK